MSDLISRADAIEAVMKHKMPFTIQQEVAREIDALPSADAVTHDLRTETHECVKETHDSDLISRADVLKYPIRLDHYDEVNGDRLFVYGVESVIEYVESLPSADAEQVTGKLQNPCDSLLTEDSEERKEQKSKLGLIRREDAIDAIDDAIDADSPQWAILRTKIGFLPSADDIHGEWIRVGHDIYECSLCHQNVMTKDIDCYSYCHRCGARMKGGAE